jgi:thiamine-phosphate pyrophosphorylase
MKGYYFITDASLSRAGNASDIKSALAAGVRVVQYRDKQKQSKALYEEAMELRALCKKVTFLINDRVDIALAVEADGVHLGQGDLPYTVARKLLGKNKIIGLTVHNLKEAEEAERMGADYLGVSPVFTTATKNDAGTPVGVGLIKQIKLRIRLPVAAIGGINFSNAPEAIGAGADAICAISVVVTQQDIKTAIEKLQGMFDKKI